MGDGNLWIRGGQVLGSDGFETAEVWIRDGKVEAKGPGLEVPAGTPEFDATGKWVLPGIIDPQVHFREPGLEHKEDLQSGSRCGAIGGVTSLFEMPNTNPPTTDPAALEDKFARARGRMATDHAFFLGATPDNAEQLGEWEGLPGCAGIKVFMGSSTGSLLVPDDPTLERILRSGTRRVTVHSEDDYILKQRYADLAEGTPVQAHPEVRSIECAVRATTRLLDLAEATGRPIHVLHISTADELELIRERDLGDLVTCEATPNHLFLAAPDCYDEHGTWAQMNPPVRDAHHRDALRRALREGPVTCIGSDHAPHTPEEKAKPYPHSPSGIAGTQTILPLFLTAVRDGWLEPQDIVRLCVEGPIRVYGLEGKGPLAPGVDGDVAIVDPELCGPLDPAWLKSRAGRSPFEGREMAGMPVATVLRGQIVAQDGELVGEPRGLPVRFASGSR